MNDDHVLVKFNAARQALAVATKIDEVKQVRDQAEALRLYIKQQHGSLIMQNQCAEIKLRSERRAGELLAEKIQPGGDRRSGSRSHDETLKEIGINKSQSSRWQAIATMPETKFEQHLAQTQAEGEELTTAGVLKEIKTAQREQHHDELRRNRAPVPTGKFSVIYADPPWSFANSGLAQSSASQYPTLDTTAIETLPIRALAADTSALFLWVPNAMLPDGLAVCEAWGFSYKTNLVWIKDKAPGMGWYVQSQHEMLLLATRGTSVFPKEKPVSWVIAPVARHSEKPRQFYNLIEQMYDGPYVELFARNTHDGWQAWGNEV